MNLFQTVKKYPTQLFLIGISFLFFLLRLPSVTEPYWYGDEGIYEVIGTALRHQRMLYSGIWDNKPPLLYLIYALFSGNQESVRFFSLLVGIASVCVFFLLAKKLFSSTKAIYVSTTFFAVLFGIPFLEGNIANAENFMLLPGMLAGLLIVKAIDKFGLRLSWKHFFLAGLLLGISFLIKVVAVFDFAAFMIFIGITTYTTIRNINKQILPLIGFLCGFLLPLVCTFFVFLVSHELGTFIKSAFLSNVGYVGYGNYFLFPQGLLVIKLVLLGSGVVWLFLQRRNISKEKLFVFLWIIFSLFSALFSQRPYTHYLLVLLPAFSLFIGMSVATQYKKLYLLFVLLILFVVFVFAGFRPQVIKSVAYYGNNLAFVSGSKPLDDYLAFFDRATVRDYKIAEFINANKKPGDSLFVWGNNGQMYALTNMLPPGRFIVAYHISATPQNWEETASILKKSPPTFVVVTGNSGPIPYSLHNYTIRLALDNMFLYEKNF